GRPHAPVAQALVDVGGRQRIGDSLPPDRVQKLPLSEAGLLGRPTDRQIAPLVSAERVIEPPAPNRLPQEPSDDGGPVQRLLSGDLLQVVQDVLLQPQIHLLRLHLLPPESSASMAK